MVMCDADWLAKVSTNSLKPKSRGRNHAYGGELMQAFASVADLLSSKYTNNRVSYRTGACCTNLLSSIEIPFHNLLSLQSKFWATSLKTGLDCWLLICMTYGPFSYVLIPALNQLQTGLRRTTRRARCFCCCLDSPGINRMTHAHH